MRVAERRGMQARRDDPGEMRHVDHEQRAHLVGDRTEFREIDLPRIGGAAGDDQLGLMLLRQPLDLVEVDQMRFGVHAILHRVEPLAAHRRARAVGQVAAGIEAQSHDRVAGLGQRQHHCAIRLRARMRLDVGEAAAEQLLRAIDRQLLHLVRRMAALIIALPRIALGIFVGENRSLRLEHRLGDDVLAGDQFDLVLLALEFVLHAGEHRRVGLGKTAREETIGLNIGKGAGVGAHAKSFAKCGWPSLSMRGPWRPPAKVPTRNDITQALAISSPINRAPIASTFASLCSRASAAA